MCTCDLLLREGRTLGSKEPHASASPFGAGSSDGGDLPLVQFAPRSMLQVAATRIERPRFPVIDLHTHLSWSATVRSGVAMGERMQYFAEPQDLLPVMDRKNVRTLINLTGGSGAGLEETIRRFDHAAPGRFLTLTEPSYGDWLDSRYPQLQADAIGHARRAGARGLKVLKTLGLYLREGIDLSLIHI